jgi:predicted peptidase
VLAAVAPLCLLAVSMPGRGNPPTPSGRWQDLLEKRTFRGKSGKVLRYRLLKPDQGPDASIIRDPSSATKYPLVVFLHGAGERGSDNEAQLLHGVAEFAKPESRKQYPCFLIAPQCPDGKKWVEVDWSAATHTQPEEPSESEALLLELIPALEEEYRIDPKRIYLTGLSMGGYGTWDLLARRPDLFAAGVPVCGGGDEKQAETLAKMPIWAFHGDKDTAVPVSRSRNMIAAIKKTGGKPHYTEYTGRGHDSWVPAYKDEAMMKWLFEQKKVSPTR